MGGQRTRQPARNLGGRAHQFPDRRTHHRHQLRQGFVAAGVQYDRPDVLQRTQFAAGMIPKALQQGDDSQAGLVLAMICASLPDLKQIQYRSRGDGGWDIAFINDRSYAPDERPIQFDAAKP